MSGTLSPMIGMGSNGLSAGAGTSIPPGLLAMLMYGGGGVPAPTLGAGGGAAPSPATALMRPPQGGVPTTVAPPVMPQGAPQQAPTMMSSLGGSPGLSGLLAALKGDQQGLAPSPAAGSGGQMAPPVLPGVSGAGGNPLLNLPLLLRSMGFGGGWTGGAPT